MSGKPKHIRPALQVSVAGGRTDGHNKNALWSPSWRSTPASPYSQELVNQPHARRSNDQACADKKIGPYSLSAYQL
jgi:hypothetical protein